MESTIKRIKKAIPTASDVRALEAFYVDGRVLVTPTFLSEFYGVARRTVTNWSSKGLKPAVAKDTTATLYDLHEVVDWHGKNISKQHSSNALGKQLEKDPTLPKIDHENIDLSTASLEVLDRLKAIEDVKKKRTENAKTRGDLVPAEDLDRAMAEQAVLHRANYEEDLELLPSALEGKSRTDIMEFLDHHYGRRIEHTHEFLSKVFDAPDWLFSKIQELLNERK